MSNCPHCGLFRYDLSGCICSDKDFTSDWNQRYIEEIFNPNNNQVNGSKKTRRPQNLLDL
ncbi:MAG: hypothetical protein ACQET8_19420 [Bacillota bacterium]|uniref:Cysteine-rich CPCC domain-containing protein n=1 Tax=Fictibacillus norfolkensis TaxID=2762233 RepID=A0ABR8SQH0_9BACL|nr:MULTISPECIES: hypothetical protein [Fictibacillus]MBD7965755.1 hypothetical protein [Fictibacillus norfolkensis]MBH0168822.1 hypothetical protein [Fictibacillus sp. 18YEL24]